jgi:hypothetical protein
MPKIVPVQTPVVQPAIKQTAPAAPVAAPPVAEKAGGWQAKSTAASHGSHDIGGFFHHIGSEIAGGLASTVGLLELAGVRYPVSSYSAKVSDTLTRGSRIDKPEGYASLKAQGFKGIVDLTAEGTGDAKNAPAAGLNTLNVKIIDNSSPNNAQMKQFLDFATNPANQPAYVHCEAGKGRTGVAVACYRMAVQGWSADQAIADGNKLGLALPNQIDFIREFSADLKAGKIDGYPKPAIP